MQVDRVHNEACQEWVLHMEEPVPGICKYKLILKHLLFKIHNCTRKSQLQNYIDLVCVR